MERPSDLGKGTFTPGKRMQPTQDKLAEREVGRIKVLTSFS